MLTFFRYRLRDGLIETVQQTPADDLPKDTEGTSAVIITNDQRIKIHENPDREYFYSKNLRNIAIRDNSGALKETLWL